MGRINVNHQTLLDGYNLDRDSFCEHFQDEITWGEAFSIDALPHVSEKVGSGYEETKKRDDEWCDQVTQHLYNYSQCKPYEKNKQQVHLAKLGEMFAKAALGYVERINSRDW